MRPSFLAVLAVGLVGVGYTVSGLFHVEDAPRDPMLTRLEAEVVELRADNLRLRSWITGQLTDWVIEQTEQVAESLPHGALSPSFAPPPTPPEPSASTSPTVPPLPTPTSSLPSPSPSSCLPIICEGLGGTVP